jgi:hypothetical protein
MIPYRSRRPNHFLKSGWRMKSGKRLPWKATSVQIQSDYRLAICDLMKRSQIAKTGSFCATALAGELSVENILAIEYNVIPLDGADVFQQGEIDSIGDRVALSQDPGDFARLPVDDARQDQVQAAAGVHLLPQLAGVDPAAPPVKDVPGQGVELLDLEQAAPDPAAQLRLREVLEDELCLEDAPSSRLAR